MKVVDISAESSNIGLTLDELLIVNAALNEVCNGMAIFEFETRLGADRERVALLLKEVGLLLDRMEKN
uniref:Uncharacterized protein n=1 Tax=Rheinheimera sp. BAL341 TaxID=1708203 RepID=A0A486XI65_9GAMM